MAVGQVAVTAIALATSIAFANLLSKEAYGTYQYILTMGEFLCTFSLIGLGRAVSTSVSRGHDGTLDEAFKKGLLWGVGSVLVGCAVGTYYALQGDLLFAYGVAVATLLLLIVATAKVYIPFLTGRKLFKVSSTLTVIGVLVPGLVVLATLFSTKNLFIIITAFTVSSAVTNVCLYLWCRRYKRNNNTDTHLVQEALHLSGDAMFGRVVAQLDRLLLFQFAGPAALAEYWIALSFERQFSHMFRNINSITIPKLSNRPLADIQKSLPRKVLLLYGILIPCMIAYVLLTPVAFHLVFPQYTTAILYAQVLGLLFLFLPSKIFVDVFVSHSLHHILYRIAFICAAPRLIATLVFVPWLGIWGIIIALFIDQTLHYGLTLWYFFTLKQTPVVGSTN
jgi:O-antigen/teichoic acid export membrane protein